MKLFQSLKSTRFKYGANALALTAGVIVGIILINLIITTLAGKVPLKVDLTSNKLFELSPQTVQTVQGLQSDVHVYALYSLGWDNNPDVRAVKEFLDRYQRLSPKFKLEYIDPATNPTFAQKYMQKGEEISGGSIIVDNGKKVKSISIYELFGQNQYTGSQSIQVEQKLTAALQYVQADAEQKVYFIQGFGRDATAVVDSQLKKEFYTTQSLNLVSADIPKDASVVVLINPERDLASAEIEKLDRYFDQGGKGAFMFTAGAPKLPNLESYLTEWGVTVNADLAIEAKANRFMSPRQYIIYPEMVSHDITANLLKQDLTFIAQLSKSLTLKSDTNPQRAQVTSLLKTSNESWGETNLEATPAKSPEDIPGPLDLCAIATRDSGTPATSPKILVMGSSASFEENMLNYPGVANADYLLNTFSWMTDKKDSMSIRAKEIVTEKLSMDQGKFLGTLLFILLFILAIGAVGFTVWFRRRYK